MISTRPGSPAFGVLVEIVRRPGELTAADLAERFYPAPRLALPDASLGHLARARAYTAWRETVATHRHRALRRIYRLCGALLRDGYLEEAPAQVAPWVVASAERRGWPEVLRSLGLRGRADGGLLSHLLAGEALDIGTASGSTKRQYRALVEAGVVVSPSQRWPTEAGRALVEGAGRAA